jgi:hypothetical protein
MIVEQRTYLTISDVYKRDDVAEYGIVLFNKVSEMDIGFTKKELIKLKELIEQALDGEQATHDNCEHEWITYGTYGQECNKCGFTHDYS